ncbi:MgtC/SapB family protein [Sulfurimonas diazotrophicus]|uniref:MgtC/SapB family protein n=1 Tax=Sulfurimonas diazotrophicus TaxID=3131939 RepID=A0ABZ3HAW4_9BACT
MEYAVLKSMVIALLLGFMIGMQRTMSRMPQSGQSFAGSRTFALLALIGYLAGWLGEAVPGFVFAATAVVGLLVGLSYYLKVTRFHKTGMTTQVAAVVTFLLGLMVYASLESYAIFIAVLMVVLLEIKPRLREFEAHLSSTDINAAVLLLAMSFIVLPVLPNEMIGPYELFNPYKTWLMAVIIAAISFVGYAAVKLFGHKRGLFITGAAGGLISSTGVAVSLSKMFANQFSLLNNYAAGVAVACTFMYLRVLFEAAVIYPALAKLLAPAFLAATAVGLLFTYYLYTRSQSADIHLENEAITKNPLQLSEAIKFGLIFGVIYGAIAFTENRFGNVGVYIVSLISGITDVDAITLSLSELSKDGKLLKSTAMNGIVIASVTNSLVKLGIVFWIGGLKLGWRTAQFFILTLGSMATVLSLTEFFLL